MKKQIIAAALCAFALLHTTTTIHAQSGISQIVNPLSSDKISEGLKSALNKGISDQVSTLTAKNGFYKNDLVKILLPKEIQQVDNALRKMGMASAADQVLMLMNRAAETAVKEATPIFINAVTQMSFADATSILMGEQDAATNYLKKATSQSLQAQFTPIVEESLSKVGANVAWEKLTTAYNKIPLTRPVDTDLTNYVTQQTMEGVFTMIAVEESDIRSNILGSRDTKLLKDVFSLQDKLKNTDTSNSSNEQSNTKGSKTLNVFNRLGKN